MTTRTTLVIPTFNRPALLQRQLVYYMQTGFAGDILVADSSKQEAFQVSSRWMRKEAGGLSLRHYHLPDLSFAGAIRDIVQEVRTPYVAVIPDDDFLIPSGIARCADFLDRDSQYIAAHGLGILIESADGGTDSIRAAAYYSQPLLVNDSSADRVRKYLGNYSVSLFSLHRTEIWKKIFAATPVAAEHPLCCDRSFSDELLQCALTAAYGKIAQVEGLYLVRQTHNTRNFLPAWYQWLTSEKWRPSYLWFRDKVAVVISEMDGISSQAAQEAVDLGLAEYLRKPMAAGSEKSGVRMRQLAKLCLPYVGQAALRRFRSRFASGYISLEGLMDPASPYYADFRQIYDSVTEKGRDLQKGNE